MAINFISPAHRAQGSSLAVSISPLGLIELSDEEHEVHGQRMTRYATNWAFYLGHHYSYLRETGEPQTSWNYVRALCDYTTNFSFGKGVSFETPKSTEGIVPYLLKRVWESDNNKSRVLWEMGNQGAVSGDSFIKVAYEEPWVDTIGRYHPGRVRLIPLNSSYCFPEWHPHDRTRLIRFKLKYRFWGTDQTGTRQVFSYTEITTEDRIEEYINDELLDSRPNPLGTIPITHIPNFIASGSPWGLSDIHDIVGLQREYNEKALEISDIINYHAAPVTVITGAKSNQLEKGPRKIWGGLPADAKVYNLEVTNTLTGPLNFLALIKQSMHEMTGVPESALGSRQPISNTSGVALSLQWHSMMNRHEQKMVTYSEGLRNINEHILLTLAVYEPQTMVYDYIAAGGVHLRPGQVPQLDPTSAETYITKPKWPAPLPLDVVVKLNELQAKISMGLESKKGALRELGEDQPDYKAAEVYEERIEDIKEQAAMSLLEQELQLITMGITGMIPMGDGADEKSNAPMGVPQINPEQQGLLNELVTMAYGTKLPQASIPNTENEETPND